MFTLITCLRWCFHLVFISSDLSVLKFQCPIKCSFNLLTQHPVYGYLIIQFTHDIVLMLQFQVSLMEAPSSWLLGLPSRWFTGLPSGQLPVRLSTGLWRLRDCSGTVVLGSQGRTCVGASMWCGRASAVPGLQLRPNLYKTRTLDSLAVPLTTLHHFLGKDFQVFLALCLSLGIEIRHFSREPSLKKKKNWSNYRLAGSFKNS